MPDAPADPVVTREESRHRYEVRIGGALGGFAEFTLLSPGRFAFPHTVIDPAFRGRGLALLLVREAMAHAASRGDTVVPLCPLVAKYLRENDVPGLVVSWPPHAGEAGG